MKLPSNRNNTGLTVVFFYLFSSGLDVTRRIYANRCTQPFVVQSFYHRTSAAAAHDRS